MRTEQTEKGERYGNAVHLTGSNKVLYCEIQISGSVMDVDPTASSGFNPLLPSDYCTMISVEHMS